MQDNQSNTFLIGLKIIEQGLSILSSGNINQFMRRQETSPIKAILAKYNSNQCTVEERIKIVEFLTTYARYDDGAEHLRHENILKGLSIGSLMTTMNDSDFYLSDSVPTGDAINQPKRNPLHILWCQALLFIRTLNHQLLPISQEHRRLIPLELSLLWQRLIALLGFGQTIQQFENK